MGRRMAGRDENGRDEPEERDRVGGREGERGVERKRKKEREGRKLSQPFFPCNHDQLRVDTG